MAEKIQIVSVTMPEFAPIVPAYINEAATMSLGILSDNIPSGVLCLYYSDHRYYITWFYVEKGRRREGLGTALLTEAITLLRDIEEVFPIEMTYSSQEQDFQGFFQNFEHFSQHEIGKIYTIDSKTRHKSLLYNRVLKLQTADCSSFFEYKESSQDHFLNGLRLKNPELEEYIRQNRYRFDPALSLAYGKNTIRAVSFSIVKEDLVEIMVFHAEDLAALSMLLAAGVKRLEESYPHHTIKVTCFTNKTQQLVSTFFETKEAEQLWTTVWDMRLPGEYPAFDG